MTTTKYKHTRTHTYLSSSSLDDSSSCRHDDITQFIACMDTPTSCPRIPSHTCHHCMGNTRTPTYTSMYIERRHLPTNIPHTQCTTTKPATPTMYPPDYELAYLHNVLYSPFLSSLAVPSTPPPLHAASAWTPASAALDSSVSDAPPASPQLPAGKTTPEI